MLTILTKVRNAYLKFKFEVLGALAQVALEAALTCGEKLDAEGMKYWNNVCRVLTREREKVFDKLMSTVTRGY